MAVRVYNLTEFKADLYNRITSNGEHELLLCDTVPGDMIPSLWWYDITSTATDNFAGGVIQPTLQTGAGRWLRIDFIFNQADWSNSNVNSDGYIKNKPTIPSLVSQLMNDSGFITGISGLDVANALGYTPTPNSRTITINGTSYDLTANRSWTVGDLLSSGTYSNPSWIASLAYSKLTGTPSIPAAQIQSDYAQTNSGALDFVKNKPVIANLSAVPTAIGSGTRTFGTAYQLSSTRPSTITISASVSCTLSLSGGQAGVIFLEISANGSSGWITIAQLGNSNTGSLTIGLNTIQVSTGQLIADLPTGYYWRARTSNTTGTPTYTFLGGAETIK